MLMLQRRFATQLHRGHSILSCSLPSSPMRAARLLSRRPAATLVPRRGNATSLVSETKQYIVQVAGETVPEKLEHCVIALTAFGETALAPTQRQHLHPLVIPLSRDERRRRITGLLCGPFARANRFGVESMPLVSCSTSRMWDVKLVALSPAHLLAQTAAECARVPSHPFAEILSVLEASDKTSAEGGSGAADGDSAAGTATVSQQPAASNLPPLPSVLENGTLKINAPGMTYADMAAAYASWGHVQLSASRHYEDGDHDTARRFAMAAFSTPLWTFGQSPHKVAKAIGLPELKSISKATLDMVLRFGIDNAEAEGPAAQARALRLAKIMMDQVCLKPADLSWQSIQPELEAQFQAAGLPDLARLVRAQQFEMQ